IDLMYEIRDPIHGTISFSDRERRVIDHPYVQRLRHIRQLGLSYLVYPGSTHDRFSHVTGAMHVVSRIWSRIIETSGDVLKEHFEEFDLEYFHRLLRLAALLHDTGHSPFSHVSEKYMPKLKDLDLPEGWMVGADPERQAKHEDYSVMLTAALSREKDTPIPPDEAQDIASLIHHEVLPSPAWEKRYGAIGSGRVGIHRLLRSFISGELDCDRMDYLLRDAYYTGVAYGAYDRDHLISNLGVTERGGTLVPTIDSTAVRAFEDFLLARYHMFLQVYLHKTTIAFDHFLDMAMADSELDMKMPGDADGYARLRDSTVIEMLFGAADRKDNNWSWRLVNRIPPKMLFAASNANEEDSILLSKLESALKKTKVPFFRMDSRQYLSKTAPVGMSDSGSELLVRRKMFGRIVYEPVERYSDLLNKYNEVIDQSNIYVLREHYVDAQGVLKQMGWPVVGMIGGKQAKIFENF
ncbi:MAG: HD domain-containing protein, partial [Patescibacteria group bacterium]|nr:HD domain-containing protein [Patescibacteria group bacterium]